MLDTLSRLSPIEDIYEVALRADSANELKQFYERLIPAVYPDSRPFPMDFRLAPTDWFLSSEEVHRSEVATDQGYIRPIGTLDVEFLADDIVEKAKVGALSLARHYPCGMHCPGCFSDDATYMDAERFLTWKEVFGVIDDARGFGLRSIKFLGPGELFENVSLFNILDAAEERHLPISIFTKGAELGDDDLANNIYGKFGIRNSIDLVNRLSEYSCVRILLGFNSFKPKRQDVMVGSHGSNRTYQIDQGVFVKRGVSRYTEKRNRALKNIVAAGFNDPHKGQRLSLIAAPIGLDQIDEIVDMYMWATRRNIPLVIAPTMESGPKSVRLMQHNQKNDSDHGKIKQMYLAIYSRALSEGVIDIDRLERDGLSAYMGTAACNQVANGLYLRLNGQVQACPGTLSKEHTFGNIHDQSIKDIWVNSTNYSLKQQDNNWCIAKPNSLPTSIQTEIIESLLTIY